MQSYIQSGNVVFAAEPELADRIGSLIQDSIAEQFGYDIPVVTRTARNWRTTLKLLELATG